MSDELKDVLKASDRYKKFTLPDKPACFKDMFKGRDFDAVQLHSTQIIDIDGKKTLLDFAVSLDGLMVRFILLMEIFIMMISK